VVTFGGLAPIPCMTDPLARLSGSLADHYRIERELDGGGMSRVFVAEEIELRRTVVIKIIAPELAEGLSAERFTREVKLAARLQQANIVPVFAAGNIDGLPYYTMPFVRGESLRARLSGAALPTADAINILRDVGRALAYAHAEGVVHRDIKPENILISGGAAVVTDFGIAKALVLSRTQAGATSTNITRAGTSLGTPSYMAPEQALGDPGTDHRADIYAWGVVAWELLGGAHPFADRISMQAMIAAHVAESPPSLAERRPEIPAALAALVMRCLEKNPANRPASANEVLAELELANTSRNGVAYSRRGPSRDRKLIAAGVIAGVILVAAVAVAVIVQRARRATPVLSADKSLAVLPFTGTGGDTANSYLAEGIADEVTNTLSQVPGLRLAGRISAARFAGKGSSAQDIGTSLKVGNVLDGTVRREGDRILVSAELSNAHDGLVVWHDSYERPAKDIVVVQDEIARAIAGQLQITLAASTLPLAESGTRDANAYDLYLKGVYFYRRRGTGITDAISTLEQATARDPTFARAWAALATTLTVSPSYLTTRASEVLPRARAAAEHAVRLDPELSVAHEALGYVDAEQFRWNDAESELRRAIALDPNNAEAEFRLGYTLVNQARFAEAVPVLRRAEAIDPLYVVPAAYLGSVEVSLGRVAEGKAELRRALALEPGSIAALSLAASSYDPTSPPDSVRAYARHYLASSKLPARIGGAASILARSGDRVGAEALVRQLEDPATPDWTRWTGLASAYLGLGDTARAISAMQRAAATSDGDAFPEFMWKLSGKAPSDPRVDAVLRRYNLDPALFEKRKAIGKQ
jgi:eukaryotic-like serine/threonine-protein kinase